MLQDWRLEPECVDSPGCLRHGAVLLQLTIHMAMSMFNAFSMATLEAKAHLQKCDVP